MHFQYLLSCPDNGQSFQLTKDPIGWDNCVYRMERHKLYQGIFNQFTLPLKFHTQGGGKQFIDAIYQQYDINGNIYITIMVDTDGLMVTYETLFKGKINLASYSEDATFTTVNIEKSDIFTKLNTRADIPVPINVPVIKSPGQPTYQSVILPDTYNPSAHNGVTTGTYSFTDPLIIPGKIYGVLTTDSANINVESTVTFIDNSSVGTQGSSNTTTIKITAISTGALAVTFANINSPIILFQVGTQTSLGQQAITQAGTFTLGLNGIPILYQSQFRMRGDINSGSHTFSDSTNILAGHTYTVFANDTSGNPISDSVTFTGSSVAGGGASSNNTTIQITSVSTGSLTVQYQNVFGQIELWMDGINPLTSDFYTPATTIASQIFHNTGINDDGTVYGGLLGFNTDTIFDNMNAFVFAAYNDFGAPQKAPSNSLMPSVLNGITEPWLKYPIGMDYSIRLKGVYTDSVDNGGSSISRNADMFIKLLWGQTLATAQYSILASASYNTVDAAHIENFDTGSLTGHINLNPGDQVWLFGQVANYQFTAGGGAPHTVDFDFNFSISNMQFSITENAKPTLTEAVMVHEALNQVVDMIADSDANLYSEFYGRTNSAKTSYAQNGPGSNRAITSGLCLRGHLDKYISLSFNEFFNSLSAIDNIGMEIDAQNRVRIESLAHFFDRNNCIAQLPNVAAYETLNENSYYYNQVEIGYGKWETELYFKNGLDEIHGKRSYATRVGAAKGTLLTNYAGNQSSLAKNQKLQKTCSLVAGNYAIELTRRKNLQFSTDDFKYDNENFIFCLTQTATGDCHLSGTQIIFGFPLYGIKPADTITISGTSNNNGTYTVSASRVDTVNYYTTITITANTLNTAHETNATIINNTRPLGVDAGQISSTGLLFPTQRYNLSITPARMLQANMNLITAGLQKINGNMQFLNGQGNFQASTTMPSTGNQHDYSGQQLYENQNIAWNDANVRNIQPLWLPEIYRFECPLKYTQFKQILNNPNGYIQFFKFANQLKNGFILSMDYNLKTGLTKFELLKMNQ